MAKRKKNSGSKKSSGFGLKLSKKTGQKFTTLGLVAVIFFAILVYHHSKTHKILKPAPVPKKTTASPAPRTPSKPKAEPIVYFKKTSQPARQVPMPALRGGGGPKLVFVIDDIGNTKEHVEEFKKLGSDVTYAILPLLRHTKFFGELSRQTGAEVILHLPLESSKGTIPGPGLITAAMPDAYVLEELQRNLASIPHVSGANNHMGSKGTSDPRIMSIVLKELKRRNLFFLDSRTTSKSAAPAMAHEIGLPLLKRDEFLDNEDSIPAIKEEIRKMTEKARRQGYAIGIGHYRWNTIKALQEEIPRLKREGFEIVSLRNLLKS